MSLKVPRFAKIGMVALFLVAALYACVSHAEPIQVVTACQDNNPERCDPTNKARPGFCAALLAAIEFADPSLKFVGQERVMPLLLIEQGMKDGRIDAYCGLTDTPKRRETLDYAPDPLMFSRHSILVRADDPMVVLTLQQLAALPGRVAVNRNSVYHTYLLEAGHKEIDATSDMMELHLGKLLSGQVRSVYYVDSALRAAVLKAGATEQVRFVGQFYRADPLYLTMRGTLSPTIKARIKEAVRRASITGGLSRAMKGYKP